MQSRSIFVSLYGLLDTSTLLSNNCVYNDRDGIHFTPAASATVASEIRLTISQADWTPSLHWESLPDEFDISISPSALG